ncbi:MAG: methyltransferase domain-containing protein [Betaproteobacteria bacterium]|nr:methyltransferase domain-containing protein [Betaproteobacteria bacterium]
MVAVVSDKKEFIFQAVQEMYTDVAKCPGKGFHFPTGRLACLFVGYPAAQLDEIPDSAVESFAGVGYPFAANVIREGAAVLDIGSGSGTDALIACNLVAARGRVYGLDMTEAMQEKLRANAAKIGAAQLKPVLGNAEEIPLPDEAADVATSNGVINLVPDKPRAFREIFRVLRRGGSLQLADIVLAKPISEKSRENPRLWAECIVGAVKEDEYLDMIRSAGFSDVQAISHLDYFSGSSNADTRKVARSFGTQTVVLRARKP